MALQITGLDEVRAMLAGLAIELKDASDKAQTRLAYTIMLAEKDQMDQDLDRPTPWSKGALRYKAAGKPPIDDSAPLIDGAAVYFVTPFGIPGLQQEEWLGVQALSGQTAGPKRSELALQALGALARDYVWVPDPAVKLDTYGNVPGTTIQSMLAALKTGATGNWALWGPKDKPLGVRANIGGDWVPYLWFVPRKTYRARWDFYGRAERETDQHFVSLFNEEVQRALDRLK
jgi:hypothetical protein